MIGSPILNNLIAEMQAKVVRPIITDIFEMRFGTFPWIWPTYWNQSSISTDFGNWQ
jgi:hypothetical protein